MTPKKDAAPEIVNVIAAFPVCDPLGAEPVGELDVCCVLVMTTVVDGLEVGADDS